jgi:uncharacterized protein (DUF924 family)
LTPADIIGFWVAAGESKWFARDSAFDGMLSVKFGGALTRGREGKFAEWAENADGALALVILLDQFSRNIYRGSPLMFTQDLQALRVARQAIARGFHQKMPASSARWFVMPFEHAEDVEAQWRAVGLLQAMGLNEMLPWARLHLDVIQRFGRFPHRNRVLGRQSTPEELAFLASGGFAG